MTSSDQKVRARVREHGWVVIAVSDLGCDHATHVGPFNTHSGHDPYVYTAGLTEAGLPELLLQLPGKNTKEWIFAAHRLLDKLAGHTLHQELTIGETLPGGIGVVTVTVKQPEPFSRADGAVWLGEAFRLYGRNRVQALEIEADWGI